MTGLGPGKSADFKGGWERTNSGGNPEMNRKNSKCGKGGKRQLRHACPALLLTEMEAVCALAPEGKYEACEGSSGQQGP